MADGAYLIYSGLSDFVNNAGSLGYYTTSVLEDYPQVDNALRYSAYNRYGPPGLGTYEFAKKALKYARDFRHAPRYQSKGKFSISKKYWKYQRSSSFHRSRNRRPARRRYQKKYSKSRR